MDYQEALNYIHGTWKFGTKLGLQNITRLLQLLGEPHKCLKCIHIAGTNGKGSIAAMTSSILREAGYKTGLFISPYLEDFRERIQINDQYISQKDLARITKIVKEKVDEMLAEGCAHPTEFEIVTAIGFYYFAEQKVDYAVIEVGLGGRLDSTNVINPMISIITSIDYDHMDILGDTLAKIAWEKAGIIKPYRPVIVYPQQPEAMDVIKKVCFERESPLFNVSPDNVELIERSINGQSFNYRRNGLVFEGMFMPFLGDHQLLNVATAITAMLVLREQGIKISDDALRKGLRKAHWPGRLELVHREPFILLDGAHNPQGARSLANAIKTYFSHRRIIMVLGILADKDVSAILNVLIPIASSIITTRPDSPRALPPDHLAAMIDQLGKTAMINPSIEDAIDQALKMAKPDDLVVVSGSLYLIGRARSYLKSKFAF